MKKHLLLSAVLFVCSFQSFSQDTLANMLEVGNKWTSDEYSTWMAPPHLRVLEVVKDTLINGNQLFKVKNDFYHYSNPTAKVTEYNYYSMGTLSLNIYDTKGDSLVELYSFSGLNKGDSIKLNTTKLLTATSYMYQFNLSKPLIIDSIDYCNLGTRKIKRIRVFNTTISDLGSHISYVYFYNGIGSEGAGLNFAQIVGFESTQKLNCFMNNGVSYVQNTFSNVNHTFYKDTVSECKYVLLDLNDETLISQITLSKSSENQLQLKTELNLTNTQITIFDMKGTEYRSSLHDQNKIDISTLTNGLYILKLQTADNKLASFKFIKN